MKLISCHIENFGKLHDYSVDFTEQKNIICEENGWGKSTLAGFIRAMFYGLDGQGKQGIEKNERKRYEPWQGGIFGGKLVFEVNGKQYEVTRSFGAKEEYELRDAKTNLISNDYSANLGEELFQVNRESFVRTSFIGQNDCQTGTTDDINAKIGNLTDNTNDLNNYEKADEYLKKLLNAMTPKRSTGSLAKRAGEITELERKVSEGSRIGESIAAYQEKLQEEQGVYESLKEEIRIAGIEQARISKLQSDIEKKKQWVELQASYSSRKEEADELRNSFPGEVPKSDEIDEMLETSRQLQKMRENLIKEQQESLVMMKANLEAEKQEKKSMPMMLVVGLVLLVLGAAVAITLSVMVGIVVAIVGVILSTIGLFGNKKEKPANQEMLQEIEKLQKKISEEEAFIKKTEADVAAYLALHGNAYDLHDLKGKVERYYLQKTLCSEAKEKMEAFRSVTDEAILSMDIPTGEIASLEELNEKISRLTERREKSFEVMNDYKDNIEELQEQYDEWEEIKLRLEEMKKLQDMETKKYKHIEETKRFLGLAKESMTSKYVGPILESFSRYYETITNGSAEHFRIDANTNLTVDELGKQRDVKTLSSGYKDLIGICLRVALVDAMYKDELPVLIMDDPFINLDDEKLVAAKRFLEKVAEKYQVIYFTCSNTRI